MNADLSRIVDRSSARDDPAAWTARSAEGMVVAAHVLAADAGAAVLADGGNAFDAAIAVSLTLSVCEPAGSGIGGMGLAVCFDARTGRPFTVESPCRAPQGATPAAVASSNRYRGYAAVATPGLCAALAHLETRYARLPRAALFEAAIRHAGNGVPVTRIQHTLATNYQDVLKLGNATDLFFSGEELKAAGSLLVQPDLARTLTHLRDAGFTDFYSGDIAAAIASDMRDNGGFVAAEDLALMPAPGERKPLTVSFDGGRAATLGPPGGGLNLCQLLSFADQLPPDALDPRTPEGVVAIVRLIMHTRRDRIRTRLEVGADEPGEAAALIDPEYVRAQLREVIGGSDTEAGETTHFCTADREGNWVSMTQSIERSFGAGCAKATLGFLYNGYLRAFKVKNERHPYFLRPGCPARSNAAPLLHLKEGAPVLAIGSTGSERMHSGIFEVLLRLRSEPPFAAVQAPRLHATPGGTVLIERDRFPPSCVAALAECASAFDWQEPWAFSMGGLQLLIREGGEYVGVGEPRRDGAARGPV